MTIKCPPFYIYRDFTSVIFSVIILDSTTVDVVVDARRQSLVLLLHKEETWSNDSCCEGVVDLGLGGAVPCRISMVQSCDRWRDGVRWLILYWTPLGKHNIPLAPRWGPEHVSVVVWGKPLRHDGMKPSGLPHPAGFSRYAGCEGRRGDDRTKNWMNCLLHHSSCTGWTADDADTP